jgi:hypothetical protein
MVKIVGMQIERICTCLGGANGDRSSGVNVIIRVETMKNSHVVSPLFRLYYLVM